MNENQVGVILEEVRDMFRTLAEGQGIIESDIKVLKEDVRVLKDDMKQVKVFMAKMEDGFNDHEHRIKCIERKTS